MKKKTYPSYIESIYHNIEEAVANDIAGSGSPWWGVAIGEKIATGAMLDEYYKALMADASLSKEDKEHITALYESYRNLYAAALDTASKSKEIIELDEAGYVKKEVASKIFAETSKATVLPPLKAEQIKADTEYSDKIVAMYQPIFQPGAGQGQTKIPVIENSANAVIRHIAAKTFNATPIVNELIPELEVYIAELQSQDQTALTKEQIASRQRELEELVKCIDALYILRSKLGSSFVSISQLKPEERYYLSYGLEKITLRYGGLFSLKNKKEDQEKNTKWGNILKVSSEISEDQYKKALKEIKNNSPNGTDLSKLRKLEYNAVEKAFGGVKSEEDAKKIMLDLVGTDAAGLAAGAKSNPPANFKGFNIVKWREETLKPLYSQKNLYSFMLDISARLRFLDKHPLEVVRYNAYADRAKSPEKYDAIISRENKQCWEISNSLIEKFVNHYSENGVSAGDLPKIKNYFELLIRSMSLEKMQYMLGAFDTDIKPSLPKINTIEVSPIKRSFFGALCNDPERQVELLKLLKKISINEIKIPIKRETITKLSILDNKLTGIKTEQIKAFNLNNSLGNAMVSFSDIKDGDAKLEHLVKVIKRPNLYGALAYFSERSGGKGANMVEWFEGNVRIFDNLSGVKVDIGINLARNIAQYIDNKLIKDLPSDKKPKNTSDDKIEILDATTHIRIAALVERCKQRSNIANSAFSDNPNLMVEIQTEIQKAASITSTGMFRKTYKVVINEKMLEDTLPTKFNAIASELQKAALTRKSSSARSEPPPPARYSSTGGAMPQTPQGPPPPPRLSSSRRISVPEAIPEPQTPPLDRMGPPPPARLSSSRLIPVPETPLSPTAVQIHMPTAEATPVIAPVTPRTTPPKAVPPTPPPSRPAPTIPGIGKEEHPKTAGIPGVTQKPLVTTTTKQAATASPLAPKPVAQSKKAPVMVPTTKPNLTVNTNAPSTVPPKLSPGVEIGKPLPKEQRGAPPPSKSLQSQVQASQHPTSHASRVAHTDAPEQRKRDASPGLEGLRRNSNIKELIAAHGKDPKPIAPKQPPSKHLPPARPGTKPTQPPPSGHWR